MRLRLLAALGALILSSRETSAQGIPTGSRNNVTYATVGGQPLRLNITFARDGSAGPWPLVIFIHGGGWTSGTHSNIPPFIAALPYLGLAVASVEYRLTSEAGQWGSESVVFPAQIHDVKGAIRFLRSQAAEYNLDVHHFAVWGPSAGGHLAALAGTSGGVAALEGTVGGNLEHSSGVHAVVDYYGPTDILNMAVDATNPPGSSINHDDPSSPESALIGFNGVGEGIGVLRANATNPAPPFPELIERVQNANPISWVDANDPPFFIVHGESDTVVPTRQSQRLADALSAAGVQHTLYRVAGMTHASPPRQYSDEATAFLQEELGLTGKSFEGWEVY